MRQATIDDAPALARIGESLAAEARPPAPFSLPHCEAWLRAILAQSTVVCFVEELTNGNGDRIIGSVLGCISGNPWQPHEIEARCEYVYVAPAYRNSRIALRLMAAFQQWASERGAKGLFFSATTSADLDALARLIGAECVGKNFWKAL